MLKIYFLFWLVVTANLKQAFRSTGAKTDSGFLHLSLLTTVLIRYFRRTLRNSSGF